jgi:hypothetical protein
MTTSKFWIADTPISMPRPATAQRPVVHVFEGTGFGLTTYGLTVAITDADRDEMLSGYFGPPDAPIEGGTPGVPQQGELT